MDNQTAIVDRLPLAAGLIIFTTLILVFLFTGSVLIPIKAIVLNVITLAAVLGAVTWVFQEGNFSELLGFEPRPIDLTMPILLFCIAFGLSMDYELFLIARMKELHDRGASLHETVAGGLAATGRITTAAAAVLSVTFLAFLVSRVTSIQLFGPANWWAPAVLRRVHERVGLTED